MKYCIIILPMLTLMKYLSSCISERLSLKQFDDIDINAQVNALESVIKEELDRQVPFVKRRVKLKKQPLWFTDEIHRNISLRNECKDKGDYFYYKKTVTR